jgi:superfamily II DNA or RNA helicase
MPRHPRSGSWTTRFAPDFDAGVRARGELYAATGRVHLTSGNPEAVAAEVRGTELYEVAIGVDEGEVTATCTCPFYAGGEFCKHVWATLVVAELRGHLEELRTASPDLRHAGDPPLLEDARARRDDLPPRPGAAWARAAARVAPPRARPRLPGGPPSWRELLRAVTEARRAPEAGLLRTWGPSPGRLSYHLDAAAALQHDEIRLTLADRRQGADGAWTEWVPVPLRRSDVPRLVDPEDRRLAGQLLGAAAVRDSYVQAYGGGYGYELGTAAFKLDETQVAELLPDLCRTGRFFLCRGTQDVDREPTAWDETPIAARVRLEERPDGYAVTGDLAAPAPDPGAPPERLPLGAATLLLRGGVAFLHGRAARFEFAGDFAWIQLLRRHGELAVPHADVDDFLEAVHTAGQAAGLELPPALRHAAVPGTLRPVLRLRAARTAWGGAPARLDGALAFSYDGLEVPAADPRPVVYDRPGRRLIQRDRGAEDAAKVLLIEHGLRPPPPSRVSPECDFELPATRLPRVVPPLLAAGFHVEAEDAVFRAAGRVSLRVTTGLDWFDVDGGVTFGDEVVPLPRLLEALRSGERFVRLGNGGFGVLPEEWLQRAGLLLRAGTPRDGTLRFTRSQTLLLDALLAAEPDVQADAAFTELRDRLQAFDGVALRAPPRTFRGTLRPYQRAGLGWLRFLRDHGLGGCLADDMGLGKTVQVLAWLEERRRARGGPSLVVAPRSVIFNWQAEAARFTPRLRVAVHDGAARARGALAWPAADLVLTTYGILRRDAAALKDVRFDCVVLDEAQAIKNASSATAKAARLLKAEQRLALSGTPIENHLGELWSLIEFLNPGMLGSASVFRAALEDGAGRDPAARELLARALRPMLLRRTKEHVAPELPPRSEQVIAVDLEPAERARYDELRAHYQQALLGGQAPDWDRARFHVLEGLLRLRQAACHGGLLDPKLAAGPSAKLAVLRERLREIVDEGHKALVFSQFTSLLALVRAALERDAIRCAYLDGATRDRAAEVARFQTDPACPVFLISLKAGGLGLNLTAAEYVFLLDPWWNPAVEAQAIDRTHRIGQERSVFAYRLVARDTVEEKVLALQQSKRDLADAVLRADRSLLQDLTREDLALLLA